MANKIKAVVVRQNEQEKPNGKIVFINVLGAQTEGHYWRVPVVKASGTFLRYDYIKSAAKPTVDSVKTLRVQNKIDTQYYWVLIADTDNGSTFNALCNAAENGTVPAMPAVTIPQLLLEQTGSYVDGVSTSYFTIVDSLNAGESYVLTASKNGAYLTPDLSGNAYASVAAALAAAAANWGAGGANSFSNPSGNKLTAQYQGATTGSISLQKALTFQSAAVSALAGGANNYKLVVTADGVSYDAVYATTVAGLVAAAAGDTALALLGSYAAQATNTKVQLLTTQASIVTLTITQVTL